FFSHRRYQKARNGAAPRIARSTGGDISRQPLPIGADVKLRSVRSCAATLPEFVEPVVTDCEASDSRRSSTDGEPIYEFHNCNGCGFSFGRQPSTVRLVPNYSRCVAWRGRIAQYR